MSFLITETESTRIDIPLIAIPDANGKYLLVRSSEGYEWRSYNESETVTPVNVGISDSSDENSIMVDVKIEFPHAHERIQFINSGGVTVTVDGKTYLLDGIVCHLCCLVKDPTTFVCERNTWGLISIQWLNATG